MNNSILLLENDDSHTVEFVTDVLKKYFQMDEEEIKNKIVEIEEVGSIEIFEGTKELAEFKQQQVQNAHLDPEFFKHKCVLNPLTNTKII